ARHVHKETGMKNLCLAGGVALNCVANGRLLRESPFEKYWIQPAAGDAGGAIGAALAGWFKYLDKPRNVNGKNDFQKGSFLGPEYSEVEIKDYLESKKIPFQFLNNDEISVVVADLIAEEKVVGWFQGRMEFGPRALGGRSIIGDARSSKMQSLMNLKIKFRESFRPFAPSVLYDKVSEYFDIEEASPYMLLVAEVKKEQQKSISEEEDKYFGIEKLKVVRSNIPSVTHVDFTARIQTVHDETNHRFYDLLKALDKKYGCATVINTSFNVRGEPIVCTPEDAFKCFMRTGMDYLMIGNFLIDKNLQIPLLDDSGWKEEFKLD
ncbi:MAG: carbamoyltransferase C-terminal domain-containing protein, partial [Ignavibacteriaceae bacterium]